ncbi:hypothetical protein U1Q18_026383 [Sarracenia purpurea var. burkii]
MWLRNPFSRLSPDETIDLQIGTDAFNGNEWSDANAINTGFYMIRSNGRTTAMFDAWYGKKDGSVGKKEQDVLQEFIHEPGFRDLGLRVRFLDTLYFSGFCQDSRDVTAVVTVHANCCRTVRAKVVDLTTVIHDWKRSQGLFANQTSEFRWSEHIGCKHSW